LSSGNYRLFETSVFIEDLEALDKSVRDKLKEKLRDYVYPQLKTQPHFGPNIKKLRNWEPETWRYRIGSWRVFYEVNEEDKIVSVITVDPRKDAYSR
jgi:mRNA interferase RelE/StbE